MAVIGGRIVAPELISGVLTCVSAISENELDHVVPEDRAYVAAEMTALMVSWLSGLTCPIMNRPTPGCLMGPAWHPAQWVHAASALGIPARPVCRRVRRAAEAARTSSEELTAVTVVGEAHFGEADPILGEYSRRLAKAAGVDLLTTYFTGRGSHARLVAAELMVDIAHPEIGDAILAQLTRRQ
jgi:hypothetical protein